MSDIQQSHWFDLTSESKTYIMHTRLCHKRKAYKWIVSFHGICVFLFLTFFYACPPASAGDSSERLMKAASLLSQESDKAENGISPDNVEESLKILTNICRDEPQMETALKQIKDEIESALREKVEKRQELLDISSQKILALSRIAGLDKASESNRSRQSDTLKSVVNTVTAENPFQCMIRKVRDSIIRLIKSILEKLPVNNKIGLGEIIFIISVVLLCSLLAAVIAIIVYYIVASSSSGISKKRSTSGAEEGKALNEEQLLEKASIQAENGSFTDALRLVCQAMIALLVKNKLISPREGKTNREYVLELANKNSPGIMSSFKASTVNHEKNWYGKSEATREDYDSVVSDFQNILGEIRHNREV